MEFKKYKEQGDYHWGRFHKNKYNYAKKMFTCSGIINHYIENISDKKIIDLGCGDGVFSVLFCKDFKKVFAIDDSALALSFLEQKIREHKRENIEIVHDDLGVSKKYEDADVAVMIDVIEHISRDRAIEILLNLKTEYVFVCTPVKKKQGTVQDTKYHIFEYFKKELRNLMLSTGYEIEHFLSDGTDMYCLVKKSKIKTTQKCNKCSRSKKQ